jgi:hypothetical protein
MARLGPLLLQVGTVVVLLVSSGFARPTKSTTAQVLAASNYQVNRVVLMDFFRRCVCGCSSVINVSSSKVVAHKVIHVVIDLANRLPTTPV